MMTTMSNTVGWLVKARKMEFAAASVCARRNCLGAGLYQFSIGRGLNLRIIADAANSRKVCSYMGKLHGKISKEQ